MFALNYLIFGMHYKHLTFRSVINRGLMPLVEVLQTLHHLVNYCSLLLGLRCSVCGAVNVHLVKMNHTISSLYFKHHCCCIRKPKDMCLSVELLSQIFKTSHCFIALMHLIEFVFLSNCSSKSK